MKKKFRVVIFMLVFMFVGVISVNAEDNNVVAAYKYDEKYCMTGKEETCIKTMCYSKNSKEACKAGDIIQYKVNDQSTLYFHVMYDGDYNNDTSKITLQAQEAVLIGTEWNSSTTNNAGPVTALDALSSYTNSWINAYVQTFELGKTTFKTNFYTGCDDLGACTENTYSMSPFTSRARMITAQEAVSLGCTDKSKSCPVWMYNYLANSKEYGGTNNVNEVEEYWTMSATNSTIHAPYAITIVGRGRIGTRTVMKTVEADRKFGVKPVIVISKPDVDTSNFSETSYDDKYENQANPTDTNNKGNQTVKVADTLKTAYIGYCIGIIVLIVGIAVLVQFYRKNKINNSEK